MKIAITSDLYYPMTNGVAVFAHNLAKGLAMRGHDVVVLCPSFTGKKHRSKRDGVTTIYMKSIRVPFYPDQINEVPDQKKILGVALPRLIYRYGIWTTVDPYPEMKKVLQRFHPDVIHNQTAEMIAIAARRYAKRYSVPMVSTGHAYPDNVTGQLKLPKPVKKPLDVALRAYMMSFLKHAEYATMPTEMAIGDLVPKNKKRFKVTVEPLSNGINLSEFTTRKPSEKVLKRFKLEKKRLRVLYVGRVDPEKSISNVITAFAGVLEKVPDAELVIVGDGIDRGHLEDLVKSLGIEDAVRFLGRVMLPDIVDIYRASTVFATASETETQGIVLIEAAATGLPLVAVDAGAVRELCQNKKNGILCKPGDIDGITKALVKILQDPELCKKYGEKSVEIAKTHDLNHTLKRFEEIYREAMRLKTEKIVAEQENGLRARTIKWFKKERPHRERWDDTRSRVLIIASGGGRLKAY